MFKTIGTDNLDTPQTEMHSTLANVQEKTALLPDYDINFKKTEQSAEAPQFEPAVETGKTVSGLVGGALTLLLAGLLGFALRRRKKKY
jgi:cobalt/nickel transport system permease protein